MSPHWLSAEEYAPCQAKASGTETPSPKALRMSSSGGKEGSILFICRGCMAYSRPRRSPGDPSVCPLGPDQELGIVHSCISVIPGLDSLGPP